MKAWLKSALIYLGKAALKYAGEKIVEKADKELGKKKSTTFVK